MLKVIKCVTDVYCQVLWALKRNWGIRDQYSGGGDIQTESIQFHLENILKNMHELGEERERLEHEVQTEYLNDQRKKTETHEEFGK